ncbi:MAG: peptide chain release factor N(5)-glutamine methyltransferase [Deltaproteobacteria bacterium]|nr:peptide chain release factor N(5)-glutamine methyltransferase [Deltaproteobacteria bacterium]MBW2348350.1 peptide chain release factor N(5)-glutamine methyltransferase [Deltaproteobacteria bacterium]RLB40919.1 MAG: peptide chain release factor N(5)-glutamine methyltransferase [Deltaproteobacteria bacterium]
MNPRRWTIKRLLEVTAEYLKTKGIENPRLDAEVLLAQTLGLDRVGLYLRLDQPLTEKELSGYRSLVRRRAAREPLQYITGRQEFWSLAFKVTPDVLIPRPETEVLVEEALRRIPAGAQGMPLRILDLGTGCGAVAVAVAKEREHARVWATDISSGALSVAEENAALHGVAGRITFLPGNLFAPLAGLGLFFHLIVSNPPYVRSDELAELAPEVRDFEPPGALDGGPDGLAIVREILTRAPDYLAPGGWVLVEMAPPQEQAASAFVRGLGAYEEPVHIKDYQDRFRVLGAQKA